MNRIVVSGLALGADPEIDVCRVCDYDLSWLLFHPSSLLWIDKIIISNEIRDLIFRGIFGVGNDALGQAVKAIFEVLDENSILEFRKTSDVIDQEISHSIFAQIQDDISQLSEQFPNIERVDDDGVPGLVSIDNVEYCGPILWTIYAGILLAKVWDANILFPDFAYNFLKYKQTVDYGNNKVDFEGKRLSAFHKIISMYLPETTILTPNLTGFDKCDQCEKKEECSLESKEFAAKGIKEIIAWRDYDEIFQLRELINEITASKENLTDEDALSDFLRKESKIKRKINLIFPRVKRWTNMITMASLPIVVLGISAGNSMAATLGAATGGIGMAINKYIEIVNSQNSWVNFRNIVKRRGVNFKRCGNWQKSSVTFR